MSEDRPQFILARTPIIQDRPAIQEDAVGQGAAVPHRFLVQADAVIQAQKVERAVQAHVPAQRLVGKIPDLEDDRAQMLPEGLGQPRKGRLSQGSQIIRRGRGRVRPAGIGITHEVGLGAARGGRQGCGAVLPSFYRLSV